MRVQHNIMAMNSYRNYNNNTKSINKNIEKLSSGYKINRAGDNAAGLAISEKMRAQITGLEGAQKNAKDGISLVQTAEGALTEVHSMLNRMVELAEQSANGTYDNSTDRSQLQKEVTALKTEINRIADSSNFNGIKLLDGSMGGREVTYSGQDPQGVTSIAVTGGASQSNVDVDNLGSGSDLLDSSTFTLSYNETTNRTTVQAAIGQVDGIKWMAVNSADSSDNLEANASVAGAPKAEIEGLLGGSVTFKAIRDETSTTALATDLEYYEGMVITVNVGAAENSDATASNYRYAANNVGSLDSVGDTKGTLRLQIGDTADSFNQLNITVMDVHVKNLGIESISIASQEEAADAMASLKDAINKVSDVRGTLGATQNRLEHTINNLSVMQENIQDAESTIRDTDVADEMMKYTKNSILVQSAQAMLAQANQQPQGVLQLLQ